MPEPDPLPDLQGLDPGELLARGMNTVQPTGGIRNWTPPTPEELARLLPQYQIEKMLGHGGMGAVYKGFQERLGRAVAIKVLPAELTADAQFVSRFEREARTLAKLQHPGIVAVYDFGQTSEGHLYFVMEYVEGTDLRHIMQSTGLSPHQALEVTVQMCEALQAAHRQGVIHRDIKPANILVGVDGRVKLADFGLARPDREEAEAITHTNAVLGTPDYMAPEQYAGTSDHRADIFALGLTLYEMLTGQLPRGAFVPPSRKVQVDVRIDEVVIKALQEEPDLRFQQASEMKTAVDRVRSGIADAAPPSAPAVPPKGGGKVVVYAIAGAALLVIAAFFFFRQGPSPAEFEPKPETTPAAAPTPVPVLPAAPPREESKPDEAVMAAPTATPLKAPIPVAEPTPSGLEDALLSYRWDYRTTKPTYAYNHVLFFQKDGKAYSAGRRTNWQCSWKLTGSQSMQMDERLTGGRVPMEIAFDETFSRFEGQDSAGVKVSGTRTRLLTDQDRADLVRLAMNKREASNNANGDAALSQAGETTGAEREPTVLAPEANLTPQPSPASVESRPFYGYVWKFIGPFGAFRFVFAADGTMRDEQGNPNGWMWEWRSAESLMLTKSDAKNQAGTPVVFNSTFTRFTGNALSGRGGITGMRMEAASGKLAALAPGVAPKPADELRDALLKYAWSWNSPVKDTRVRFMADGTGSLSDGGAGTWTITGDRSVRFVFDGDSAGCGLEFNEALTSFTGRNYAKRRPLRGVRLEEIAPKK